MTPADELIGRTVASLVHPDDSAPFAAPGSTGGHAAPQELTRPHRDGDGWRWSEVTSQPVLGDDGSVVARVGGLRDVHERVLAEQARVESPRRATASSPRTRATSSCGSTPTGVIDWASGSIVELFGRDAGGAHRPGRDRARLVPETCATGRRLGPRWPTGRW